jgi:hypothetical protein
MRRLLPLALPALLVLLVACGGPSEADVQATVAAGVAVSVAQTSTAVAADACGKVALNVYADAVEQQVNRFERQAGLTGSTPRASMGEPLQRLLDLQDETERMDVPPCAAEYHKQILSMMGIYRLAYENFAAQGDEITTQAAIYCARAARSRPVPRWHCAAHRNSAHARRGGADCDAGANAYAGREDGLTPSVAPTRSPRPRAGGFVRRCGAGLAQRIFALFVCLKRHLYIGKAILRKHISDDATDLYQFDTRCILMLPL